MHYVEQYDEKLHQMEEQMRKVEQERGRAFNELRQMKKVAEDTNVMVDEILATKRIPETHVIEKQVGIKDNNIESSKRQLSEKDALLDNLRNEMDYLRSSEANAMALLSDYKRKIQQLEAELDKRRESEANLFDTLVMQTKQLEKNKILLEESKLEITSLEEKIKAVQVSASQTIKTPEMENGFSTEESIDGLEIEAELEKEMFNDEGLPEKAKTMLEELNTLKTELKSATEAEENSKKAMDDLAFALKEVATEANQVKAKLTLSQVELEHTKVDAERWRAMLGSTEEKYKELLEATRKEADRYKNTAERLRLEAEESLLAWNGKETEFVNCIKRAEEERLLAQKETTRVVELLREAENKTRVSKEENQKLRDILKQALNEANVAKEAAEIAKAENARLQDGLNLLVHENEMLKIHEAASFENIRELKRMLSESSMKEFKIEDMEKPSTKESAKDDNNKEPGRKAKAHSNSVDHRENKESKSLNKTFSLNLKDMITPHKQQHNKVGNEEANKDSDDDTLRGSIFDEVDSSDSDSRDSRHDVEMGLPDDFDHLDESHFDDPEGDRNSRKRRALLRRFGDLIRRRGYHNHRKEPSNEEHLQT
ncbi:putative WEB family protein [Spatholobus suberectus]|nr:putative WEB family protein [Spatholobus suberectus]